MVRESRRKKMGNPRGREGKGDSTVSDRSQELRAAGSFLEESVGQGRRGERWTGKVSGSTRYRYKVQ